MPKDRFISSQLIDFLEYLLSVGDQKDFLCSIISKISFEYTFTYLPSVYNESEASQISKSLRFYVLRQAVMGLTVAPNDFCKDQNGLPEENQKRIDQQKKEIVDAVGFLLPVYSYRLECLENSANDFENRSSNLISSLNRNSWRYQSFEKRKLLEFALIAFSDAILAFKNAPRDTVQRLLNKVIKDFNVSYNFQISLLNIVVRDNRAYQFILEGLERVDKALNDYPASARELSEAYLNCAKIGQKIDKRVGAVYFAKAIECTKGLDYEAYRKIYLYQTIAYNIQKNDYDNPLLSYKVIRLAEDFCRKLGDTKHFPYEAAIEAAALLSKNAIWGAICRLDDRDNHDGFSLQETLSITLETLLRYDRISQEESIAILSTLLPDWSSRYNNIVDIMMDKLSTLTPTRQKPILDILIHDVLYNLPLDEKGYRCQKLLSHIDSTVVSSILDTTKIRRMYSFIQKIGTTQMADYKKEANSKVNIEEYVKDSFITSMGCLGERLKPLSVDDRNSFLVIWFAKLENDMYSTALDWTISLMLDDHYHYCYESTLDTVASIVEKLQVWPAVKSWREDETLHGNYLSAHANVFLHMYSNSDEMFGFYLRIFPITQETQHNILLGYIVSNEQLYDEQVVKALCRMTSTLNGQENEALLEWCLDIEMEKVHVASGDPHEYTPCTTQNSLCDCIASFIWRSLGHPNKEIRWKAAHALIRYCAVENSNMLIKLAEKYYVVINPDYIDSANYFFADSARLWFLLTCLRIASDNPQLLFSLYPFFKDIACSESVSHALIRRTAKNICLLLAPHCAPDDIQNIADCDKVMHGNSNRVPQYSRENLITDCKFKFDETDTLRYWYDDIAERFACTQTDVAKECDYYISLWGITNKATRAWRERYLQNVDYHKTSNGHGSIPIVETLEKYAEWHSMFYVADKFRKIKGVVDDEYPTYEGWLDSYLPHPQGYWGNEFRKHPPYIPFLWEFVKTASADPEPIYLIPESLSDMLLEHEEKMTLSMDCAKYFEQSTQHIRIQSALVNKNQLDDLISALRKPHSFLSHFIEMLMVDLLAIVWI